MIVLPAVRRTRSGSRSRRRSRARRARPTASPSADAPLDLRARPEGRHRQDAHRDQPRGRARRARQDGRARRPRPPVRRRRPLRSASRRTGRSTTSCAPAARSTRRSSTASWSTHSSGVRCCSRRAARPGARRHGRVPARGLRRPAPDVRLRRSSTRRPGFTPEVIATIDVATDVCMVGMLDALSLKNTKLGLETLELMGYRADQRQARAQPRRLAASASPTTTSWRSSGREPDVLVPSDRDIPRSVNEGAPIVLAKPQSEAAEAFRQLAGARRGRARRRREASAAGRLCA